MKLNKWSFALLLVGTLTALFAVSHVTYADPGGRASGTGYFDGGTPTSGSWNNVLPGNPAVPSTIAPIADGQATAKDAYINFILNDLKSCNTRTHLGAAFVINLMLGRNGSAASRYLSIKCNPATITDSSILDWKDRINSGDISIHRGTISWGSAAGDDISGWNSAYWNDFRPGDVSDEVFYPDANSHKAIYFTDSSGNILFVLKTDCGNPLGDLAGLPEVSTNSRPTGHFTSVTCTWDGTNSQWVYHLTATYNDSDAPAGNPADAEVTGPGGYVYGASKNGPDARWDLTRGVEIYSTSWPVSLKVHDIGAPEGDDEWWPVDTSYAPPCGRITSVTCSGDNYVFSAAFFDDDAQNDSSLPNYNPADGEVKGEGGVTIFGSSQNGPTHTWNIPRSSATDPFWPLKLWVHDVSGGYIPNGDASSGLPTTAEDSSGFVYVDSNIRPTTGTCAAPKLDCNAAGTNFSGIVVGKSKPIKVSVIVSGDGSDSVPASASFTSIKVLEGSTVVASTSSDYSGTGTLYSTATFNFTPTDPGTYTLQWTFDSSGYTDPTTKTCSKSGPAGYAPYFNVLGGDVSAGPGFGDNGCTTGGTTAGIAGNIDTSSGFFGAGSQLGAFALGNISQFATALNPNGSDAGAGPPSGLAFANSGASGSTYGGSYGKGVGVGGGSWCESDYYADAGDAIGNFDPANLPTDPGTYVYTLTSSTLAGFTPNPGTIIILKANHNVTITGDITYGSYGSAIPRFELLVSGGNIKIRHDVGRLSGHYVAQPGAGGGTLYTCVDDSGNPSTDFTTCDNQLVVNGSVNAKNIVLGRTHGSTTAAAGTTTEPAEQFIYSPELWLSGLTGPSGSCSTTDPTSCTYYSYTSLPPIL